VTRCTPGTVGRVGAASKRLPGNGIGWRSVSTQGSTRGVKQQHPTIVTSESIGLLSARVGRVGAVRRYVVEWQRGAPHACEGRRGGSHGAAAHLRTKKISFPLAGRKSENV
jgi:hypothetical protein